MWERGVEMETFRAFFSGWAVLFIVFGLLVIITSWRQIWGLSGGYGKGIWSEGSQSMMDAREGRRAGVMIFLLGLCVMGLLHLD
jgi:hypothetical protein